MYIDILVEKKKHFENISAGSDWGIVNVWMYHAIGKMFMLLVTLHAYMI